VSFWKNCVPKPELGNEDGKEHARSATGRGTRGKWLEINDIINTTLSLKN
jgi:hypothetical protein